MQVLWRGGFNARADTSAHHLGQREHAQDRNGRRHADAAAALWPGGGSERRPDLAGRLRGELGSRWWSWPRRPWWCASRAPSWRFFEGGHDAHASRLPSQEWCALQRQRRSKRILRQDSRDQWRYLVDRDDYS